jgi:outer membrane protein insertion porin family
MVRGLLCVLAVLLTLNAHPMHAQEEPEPEVEGEIIEDIVVDGNRALSDEAFLRLLHLSPGDPFDVQVVRQEFQKLWQRGLFDDLSVESRDGTQGTILIFHIKERPRLNSVEYEKNKGASETQIDEALTERNIELRVGGPVDYKSIQDTEEVIRGLLGSKGFLDPEVEAELNTVDPGLMSLHFKIKSGSKTRIKRIRFEDNAVFSDGKLRSTLKLTSRTHWWKFWGRKKTLYHPQKLNEDLRNVDNLYQNHGFLDVRVKTPVVEFREGKKTKKPGKQKRWVDITIPVREGDPYSVGEITVEGNQVFTDDEILRRFPLKPGQTFDRSRFEAGAHLVELDYGERGYFYVSTNRLIGRKDGNVADVTIKIDEDKKYFIDTIEFVGNTTTRDKVLRRELGVAEEELFNLKRFRLGLRKVAQLGYFQLTREPLITPVPGENRVKILVEGQEQSRNEIQVGGGYSGLDGAFFAGSFSTRNFLGYGQTLSTQIQVGGRASTFAISFQDPWFLGRPWIFGASIFRRDTNFITFEQKSRGGSVSWGRRLGNFSNFSITYLVQDILFDQAGSANDTLSRTSALRPVYILDTRNNFFRPTSGFQLVFSLEYAGGPLGGDNFFWKPILEATTYLPSFGRTYFAFHGEIGYVDDFDGRSVPTFERFFLGGERSLRMFPSRSVSPRDDGTPPVPRGRGGRRVRQFVNPLDPPGHIVDPLDPILFVGGKKYLLFNIEYAIPTNETVELVLFYDAGNAFKNNQGYDLSDLRQDAGIELRFYLPIFGAPLRLIYGWVLDPGPFQDRGADFIFSVGTTF